MNPEQESYGIDSGPAHNNDHAFIRFLRQLEGAWQSDDSVSPNERIALAALITTYDQQGADSGVIRAVNQCLAEGDDIEVVRHELARAAGIGDLAMLRRFAILDDQLEKGEVETIDITGLSDEELLRLFE